jgi:hypothetical protein
MMNTFEEIKALLREKSGKKLVAFSVAALLLITVTDAKERKRENGC